MHWRPRIPFATRPRSAVRTVLLLLIGFGPIGCAATALNNPGLERIRTKTHPSGWVFRSSADQGYRAQVNRGFPYEGERCLQIESVDVPTDPFGNLMQVLNAAPYRGKRVRYRAAVRAEVGGQANSAQLWLRVDREQGKGFFDNMGDRPIRSPEWAVYEIVGDVAMDAKTLNLGVFLRGEGRLWFDAAELEIVGEAGEGDERPRPLTDRGLENLVAFTRLLGYVRYFHPSDASSGADWEALAMAGIRNMEAEGSAPELARRLTRLFAPIAPRLQVFDNGNQPEAEPAYPQEPDAEFVVWRHKGVGLRSPSIYSSRRIRAPASDERFGTSLPETGTVRELPLGAGVTCRLPIAIPAAIASGIGTDRPEAVTNEATDSGRSRAFDIGEGRPAGFLPSGNDRTTRLANVALAWNIPQHFYPYFDVVGDNWSGALREALTSAAMDSDEEAFLDTMRFLVATLGDGHGHVAHRSGLRLNRIPVLWDWVENKLVITATGSGTRRVRPGDVILKVDGLPAREALLSSERTISGATPQWKRYQALQQLGTGSSGKTVEIVFRGKDQRVSHLTLECTVPRHGRGRLRDPRPEKIEEIRPGIVYVDLDRVTDEDILEALPQLVRARGVVFDLRGYPAVSTIVLAHLVREPVSSAQWHVPLVSLPNRVDMEFELSSWMVEPQEPRIQGEVVFLTDGRAISYAETYLGIVEHYDLGEIVGSPTAGTNGNVNVIELPGGYRINWTGMRVLKHDGSTHHGVGIHPTVPVHRTIQGVREGRDEVLEKGIEVASRVPVSP